MQLYKSWFIGNTMATNRVFKVPVYQRNYSWDSTQCEKLYEDILAAFSSNKQHFTGTIVYITGDRSSDTPALDLIIDGQQRITTILILIKAMWDIAVNRADPLHPTLEFMLFNHNCPPKFRLKLEPVQTDFEQFKALMDGNKEAYDQNSLVIKNYQLFVNLINDSLDNGLHLDNIPDGLRKLEVVEIMLDKSQGDEPQVIFESINSTGLDLSLADKIRNFLLMDEVRQKELYEKYWLVLENKFGNESLNDYFILFISRLLSEKVVEDKAYSKFCKFVRTHNLTHEYLLQELTRYSKYYAAFEGRPNHYSEEIKRVLGDLRALDQSTQDIFLLDVFDDFEQKYISEEELLQVLRFIRSYSLRRIICEVGSGGLKGMYLGLYAVLFKDKAQNKQDGRYYATIYSFFKNNITKARIISDSDFRDALLYRDLYSKKKACKFLLESLENGKSKEQLRADKLTIEHIMPKKKGDQGWVKEIGSEDYESVYNKYINTLGNLTITGYNSELGTKDFRKKKEFIAHHSKAQILNKDILAADHWNEESILKRAKALADQALELFAFEDVPEDKLGIKTDDVWLSLDEKELATNMKPVEYQFYGKSTKVNNFADMLKAVMKSLHERDAAHMKKLAVKKYSWTKTDAVYISTDKGDLRSGKEIGNSGIFFETNLKAMDSVEFIARMIEQYDLDPKEFKCRCVPSKISRKKSS